MPQSPIFHAYTFGEEEQKTLNSDGYFVFPSLLTLTAQGKITNSFEE